MAQKTLVVLEDDVDGGVADETLSFALDGAFYEIDLSAKNARKLRDALAPWLGAARKVGRSGSGRRGGASRRRAGNDRTATIREWARAKGIKVSERGRLSADLVAQYDAANKR